MAHMVFVSLKMMILARPQALTVQRSGGVAPELNLMVYALCVSRDLHELRYLGRVVLHVGILRTALAAGGTDRCSACAGGRRTILCAGGCTGCGRRTECGSDGHGCAKGHDQGDHVVVGDKVRGQMPVQLHVLGSKRRIEHVLLGELVLEERHVEGRQDVEEDVDVRGGGHQGTLHQEEQLARRSVGGNGHRGGSHEA